MGAGNTGEGLNVASLNVLGEGGKWVMCGFASIVLFTKVIVPFCIVV